MMTIVPVVELSKGRSSRMRWTRTTPIGRILVASWLLAAFAGASTAAEAPRRFDAPPGPTLRVRFQDGLLSLKARQTPWNQVLTVLEQKSGIRFHPAFALTGAVSVSVPALPVMQALERLFGSKAGFICRYPMGAADGLAVPREVWVLGQVREAGAESPKDGKLGVLRMPQDPASLYSNAAMEDEMKESASQEADAIQYLTRMAEDEDPGTLVQELSAFGRKGNAEAAEIQNALEATLDDEDPSVRGAALQGLVSRGGPEPMEQLWHAFQDPDPGVRILAVEGAKGARFD